MRSFIFILLMGISKSGVSQVEAPDFAYKANTLELYYPTYYFFDNLNMRLEMPIGNFGLVYYRNKVNKKLGWHLGFDVYQRLGKKGIPQDPELGDALERTAIFINLGLDKKILWQSGLALQWFGELNHRYGRDLFYGGGFYTGWAFGRRDLFDFGLSIGSRVCYRFNCGFVASLSVKQSFYYYRKSRGQVLSFDDGSPRNVLNINLGLGWNF